MYLRAAKTEAEAAGESTEGMASSTSKLREELLDLTGQKVDIQLDEDSFKSTYQILKELAGVWDELSDISQANILEKIGGKRNANVVSALLTNFNIAEEALETSANSAGSALAENEKYLESIEGHIAQFKASFEALSTTAIDSELVKDVVDLGTGFLNAANAVFELVDSLGGLESILGAIVAYKSINFLGDIIDGKTGGKDIIKGLNSLINIIPGFKDFDISTPFTKGSKSIELFSSAFNSAFNDNRNKGVTTMTSSVNALGAGFKALTSKMSTAKIAMTAFTIGIAAVSAAYGAYKQWEENRINSAKEDIEAYNQQTSAMEDYKSEITSLKNSLDSGTLSDEEAYNARARLLEIQNEIVDNYGAEADALNLLAASADEASAAIDSVSASSAQKYLLENAGVINTAINKMNYMQNHETNFSNLGGSAKALEQLRDIISDYDNVKLVSDGFGNYALTVAGDANEAREAIEALKPELEDLSKQFAIQDVNINIDGWISSLSSAYSRIQSYVEDYEDIYNNAIKMKIASGSDYDSDGNLKTYNSILKEVTNAQLAFSKSTEGSYKTAEERAEAYASGIAAMENAYSTLDSIKWSDETVKEEFYNQLDEWQDSINEKKLYIDVVARFDNDASTEDSGQFKGILDEAENVINSGVLDELKGEDGLIDAYKVLNESLDVEAAGEATDGLTDAQMAVKGLMDVCNEGGVELESLLFVLSQASIISTQFANNISTTQTSIDSFVSSLSSMKAQQSAISDALNAQGGTGTISLDTYKALIAESEDYALCLEYENGALQVNADKALELWKARTEIEALDLQAQIANETKRYRELESRVGSLTDAEKLELDETKERITQMQILASEYQQLTSAYSMWQMAQELPESGDMYDDMQTALEQIQDGLNTGKIGTAKFETAVDMLVPEADKNSVDKYMTTLERYIQDDSDGVKNFISDMINAGFMHGTDGAVASWNDAWMNEGVTIDDICEKLKITPSMAKAIFGELEEYHFDFKWTDADFDIETLEDQVNEASNAFDQFKKDLESGLIIGGENIDASSVDEYAAKVDELTAKIKELKGYDLSIEANATALDDAEAELESIIQQAASEGIIISVEGLDIDTTTAQSQIQAVASDLDNIGAKLDIVAAKLIGDLGAGATCAALKKVYNQLQSIDAMTISDKSFTTTNTVVTNSAGSTSSGIQGLLKGKHASGTKDAKPGRALVGEAGRELIVTKNKYYVVGENGPEFVTLKRGDMVFNNSDTERMLQKLPNSNNGQAFASGTNIFTTVVNSIKKLFNGNTESSSASYSTAKAEDIAYKNATNYGSLGPETVVITEGGKNPYPDSNQTSNKTSSGSGGGGSSGSSSNKESEFEKKYKEWQHLLEMDQADMEDYLDWLDDAYKDAYNSGEIGLDDYRNYAEEVYNGLQDLFMDGLSDTEHQISMLQSMGGDTTTILNLYQGLISDVEDELDKAYASGLDNNDDYVQGLLDKLVGYRKEVKDVQDEITENAKDAYEDLIKYRMDMIKKDLENEKDAINEKLDYLKDFYSKQKDMLQDVYDEEEYLDEQAEKRKAVSDIEYQLAQLEVDNSAWATKKKLELQEELLEAEKDLADFEKEHALEMAQDLLDKQLEIQEEKLNAEIDAIDETLDYEKGIRDQAIADLQNADQGIYDEMVEYESRYGSGNPDEVATMWDNAYESMVAYFKTFNEYYEGIRMENVNGITIATVADSDKKYVTGYASGTSSATRGLHEIEEEDSEYIFESSNGKKYKMFSGGEKVLNAESTDFLYKFASSGGKVLADMLNMAKSPIPANVGPTNQVFEIKTGDIIIQGNADQKTVSQIRREQREGIDYILKEFNRLQK